MKRITLAFALSFCLGGLEVAAQSLRSEVSVASDTVKLGDFIDGVGVNGVVPVFRAPDIGTSGSVPVQHILDIARKHGITNIDVRGLTEVRVVRLSRVIPLAEMEERIANRIAGELSVSDPSSISIVFDRSTRPAHIEPTGTGDLVLSRLRHDPVTGRFDAHFEVTGSALSRVNGGIRLSGTARETFNVVVATRPMQRGELFKDGDLTVEKRIRLEGQPPQPSDSVIMLSQAKGKAARKAILAGRPLRGEDLMRPEIVEKNAGVMITYELPGMQLSVRGKAMEAGAQGDTIEVQNLQSKKNIQAEVVSANRVVVQTRARPAQTAAVPTPTKSQ